jgi:hypothetical protein
MTEGEHHAATGRHVYWSTAVSILAGVVLTSAAVGIAGIRLPSRSAEGRQVAPLVGTWRRTTTCAELVSALTKAGFPQAMVLDGVAGNGFLPGTTSGGQIADPTTPCAGAVPRKHSHFFKKGGAFGSLDWNGQQVDDGTYRITRPGTVVIFKEFPKVTFRYAIRGRSIEFTPVVPKGCTAFRCMWAIAVAYPGKTWQRVR